MKQATIQIKVNDKTKAAFKSVNARLRKMSSTAMNMKTALAGLAGVGGLGALAVSSANTADALAKSADKLGTTTEALAGLHLATKLYTSSGAPAMDEALTKATKRLGEFNAIGGGAAAQWLKKLNLDTQELAALAPDQLFARYAESIRGLNDRGQQMAAISALMGDESRQLIGIIDAGSDAIESSTQKAIAYGTALTRIDAAKIEAANDAFTQMQEAMKGVGTTLAVELSPHVKEIADELERMFSGSKNDIQAWANSSVKNIGVVIESVGVLWDGYQQLPAWAQEVGIVGALVGGTKGRLALVGAAKFMADFKTTADWWAAYSNDKIGFAEWMTTGNEAAKKKLDELRELGVLAATVPVDTLGIRLTEFGRKMQELRKDTAVILAPNNTGFGGESGNKERAASAISTQQAMLAAKLAQVNQYLMSESELEQQAYENRLFIVEDNFQNQLIGETRRKEILQNLELKHQATILAIDESAAKKKIQVDSMLASQRLGVAKGITSNMAQLMSSSSKKEFEIGKKFSQANALIKGYEAVTSSYAAGAKIGGPYLGAAYAATAAYATKIQLDNIRNAQFGGGGGISVGGGNVSTGSSFNGGAPNQPSLISNNTKNDSSRSITTINLISDGETPFSARQIEQLFNEFEEAAERGDRVFFTRYSRQALELIT